MKTKRKAVPLYSEYTYSTFSSLSFADLNMPTVTFEGFAPNYINEDALKMTLKLMPKKVGNSSCGDVFKILDK